jgi:hypothetical protein
MSDELQQATDNTVADATAPATTPVQLQLQDLLLAAQVVQLASQRGAIKAEEMEAVGGLYNRLVTFLQASGALQPAPTAPAEAPAETTADTTAPAPEADAPAAQ